MGWEREKKGIKESILVSVACQKPEGEREMIQLIITNNDTYLWWKKVKWECPDDLSMEETIEMLKAVLRTLSWSEKQIEDMIPDCDKCISEREEEG